jgi:hypothetical protein
MTTPRTSAMKATVVTEKIRHSHGIFYHHVSELVVAALTVFICAAAPGNAIPVPPGVGAGSATSSTTGGPRRSGPITLSASPRGGQSRTNGPRRPMQIAAVQPSGCNGVVDERGRNQR